MRKHLLPNESSTFTGHSIKTSPHSVFTLGLLLYALKQTRLLGG